MRNGRAEYKWKRGSGYSGKESAQVVGETLEKLPSRKPSDVLSAARPKSSPLHEFFTWSDAEAAEKQRVAEARNLLRALSVTYVFADAPKQEHTRAFVSLAERHGEQEGYLTSVKVLSDPELREQLLERALHDADVWHMRYAELVELADVFKAIARAKKRREAKKIK